ncbi:hypothetical protein TKK_0018334 [Trichogramma kaykai]
MGSTTTSQGIGNYWKSNVWMEMIANDLFVNDDATSTPSMECDAQPSYSELEVQSFVEIQEESSWRRAEIVDDGGSGGGIVSIFFDDPDYTRADENICPAVDLSKLELNNVDTDLEKLLKDSPSETLSRTDDVRRMYSNKRKANSTHDFLEMLGSTNDVFRDDLNVDPSSIVATSTPKKMNLTETSNEPLIEPMFGGKKNLSITEILWQRLCADRSIDSLDSIEPSSISGGCEISAASEDKKIDDIANDKVDTFDSKQLQEQIDTNLYEITIPSPLSLSENKSNGILDIDEYLQVSTTSDEVVNPNYPGTIEQSIYQSNLFSDESVLQRFGERLNKYKTQNQQLHFDTDWENEIDLVSRVSKFIQNRLNRKSANDVDQGLLPEKNSEGKVSTDNTSKINESAESKKGDVSQNWEEPSKKKYAKKSRLSNDNVCNNKSPVITDENFEDERRITRQFVKQIDDVRKSLKKIDYTPGRLVWAHYRSVWWPAIIIRAEDAGMVSTPKNVWVIWIGELLISNIPEKHIDLFSADIVSRFDVLSNNPKVKDSDKKFKDFVCYRTVQLLKSRFSSGPLQKPFSLWIKCNVLSHKNELNQLIFDPYPDDVIEKLNELKELNYRKTQQYLREQENERLNKTLEVKNVQRKKIEKPEFIGPGGIDIADQKPGMIVWAKWPGYSYWPCVIMDYRHLNRKQPNIAHQWVMWYGDFKYSQVEYRQILMFPAGIKKMAVKIQEMKDDLFCRAVLQAAKDYSALLNYQSESWKIDDVINIFLKSKKENKLIEERLIEPNEENLFSETIKKQLKIQINDHPDSGERKQQILKSSNIKLAIECKLSLDSLCMICFEDNIHLEKHPFFKAFLCDPCMEQFEPKMFAYGNDGKCFYCTLCGCDDVVAVCDNISCPRVFCTACIKLIISPDCADEILLKQPWNCYLCDSSQLENSIMKMRKNWRKRLFSIYNSNCNDDKQTNFQHINKDTKIRVLSLFDGIGTGLQVLKKLNVNIDCYYASEIDPDSMKVSYFNHGKKIIQLGDVRDIDENMIKKIAPIDLLIGGSPCNELSLANPKRRGLDDPEGTGVLFYEYVRIKNLVEKHNKKRHLFWLFENVASMPKIYRTKISKNLKREPKLLDSADFSAQHRPRLFWGNLPWGPYELNDVKLQDCLRKECNRQALVKKIATVTTRSNSLNQTKENIKPVLMDGKKDSLWVTELEEIFGFPIHYTDANLQKTRRLQLLGKAWSVQTLFAILQPVFKF